MRWWNMAYYHDTNYEQYCAYKSTIPQKSTITLDYPLSTNDPLWGLYGQHIPYSPVPTDSLEHLIHNTKTYGMDISDLILGDRLKALGNTVQLFTNELDSRSKILQKNIKDIDYKIVRCEGYLINLEHFSPYVNKMMESKRLNLSNEIMRLESERRQEINRYWSDKIRFSTELVKSMGEYQAAIRKASILAGDTDGD